MTERRCGNCFWWGLMSLDDPSIRDAPGGPFPMEKPAKRCRRFPPTATWGATEDAQAFRIALSVRTFHDDFCGEWTPHPATPAEQSTKGTLDECAVRWCAAGEGVTMTERERLDAIVDVLAPILDAVRINDGDTLSCLTPDSHEIWTVTGSWGTSAKITLGDLRRLRAVVEGRG